MIALMQLQMQIQCNWKKDLNAEVVGNTSQSCLAAQEIPEVRHRKGTEGGQGNTHWVMQHPCKCNCIASIANANAKASVNAIGTKT